MVPGFVGLMAFGEWAAAEDAPALASVMAVVMVALLAVFAAGAMWFGAQARKLGARAGLVPAVLAGLAGVYFLVGFVVQLLTGGGPLGG
jgi:fatty acid desaturase